MSAEWNDNSPIYRQLKARVVGMMLKESERFINKLGHQVALDQLAFVEKEVDRAYRRLQDEKAKVLAFQNSHQLISPESTSSTRMKASQFSQKVLPGESRRTIG